MKGKVLAMVLALSMATASAFAEQPEAQKYRDILQSGKYYVEYEVSYMERCLAVEDGKRMSYTDPKLGGIRIPSVFDLFGGGKSKTPGAYYENGKYYKFSTKKKATVATEEQLKDVNIDPAWNGIKNQFALPEELALFAPHDPFFVAVKGATEPQFVESGTKADDDKQIPYDKYAYEVKGQNGQNIYSVVYYVYYKEGVLKQIESYLIQNGQTEELLETVKIKKLTGEIPKNAVKIPKGCKVYAAGMGDMNDLLEKPVLVETY